ncbi:MAG: hypothetical protein ACYCYP_05145 [Leptospirales bacterium]
MNLLTTLAALSDSSMCCGPTPGGNASVSAFAALMGTMTALSSLLLMVQCMTGIGAKPKFDPTKKRK